MPEKEWAFARALRCSRASTAYGRSLFDRRIARRVRQPGLKKQMRVKAARLGNTKIDFVQEDWEGGFTIFLPVAAKSGQTVEV